MYTPFEHTVEGYELQFGTNHLGHFLLTNLRTPTVIAGAPARVVNLSSGGHRSSDIHWDDPNFEHHPYDKMAVYGQSKTANILFLVELDRRLPGRGSRLCRASRTYQHRMPATWTKPTTTGLLPGMKESGPGVRPHARASRPVRPHRFGRHCAWN